jgi:hypothetical protein
MARLTFPDQQQDLQNAADFSLASECDGSVKVPRLPMEADSGAIRLPDGVQVGWGVSEVMAAFVASLAGMWLNHDDRALRLDRRYLQHRSWNSDKRIRVDASPATLI